MFQSKGNDDQNAQHKYYNHSSEKYEEGEIYNKYCKALPLSYEFLLGPYISFVNLSLLHFNSADAKEFYATVYFHNQIIL